MKHLIRLAVILAIVFPAVLVLKGCKGRTDNSGDNERQILQQQLQRSQTQVKTLQRELQEAREKTRAAEADFFIAAVVSFSAALAFFLLLQLLIREHRSKKTLVYFLRWMQGRAKQR